MHSPALDRHTFAVMSISRLLSTYVDLHDLGIVRMEKALVELTRNSYEPGLCFRGNAKAAHIKPDQLYYPAPDLVVEMLLKSTKKYDRETKFVDYAAHGVAEYWLVDPVKQRVEQFTIDVGTDDHEAVGTYSLKQTLTGRAVAGFAIPVRATFDTGANMAALQELLT